MQVHEPRWIAACHEAGHAVAAHLLGVPTASVGIHGDQPGEGRWLAAERFDRERIKETWSNYAIIGEMGKRVELMLFESYEARYSEEDDESISRYSLTFLESDGERRAFKDRLPQMAADVACHPRFLGAVETLASRLVEGKTLDGAEASRIIGKSLAAVVV